jgi:hypothetical protein
MSLPERDALPADLDPRYFTAILLEDGITPGFPRRTPEADIPRCRPGFWKLSDIVYC